MPKTHIFIPDTQVKSGIDMTYLSAIGEYIAHKKPDVIIHAGDHADMPSLSSYDKGKAAAEGRRYHKDIDAAIEGMDLLVSPIRTAMKKDPKWQPRLVFTLGNHESYCRSTSVFSKTRGWIGVSEVQEEDELAQFSKEGITFAKPVHYTTKPFKGNLLKFKTPTNQFVVTPKHEVVLSDFTKKLAEEVTLKDSLVEPVPVLAEEIEQDPLITKLLTWVICDGCIPKGHRPLIQFKLSRQDKIDNLENLLKELNFQYTKRECKRSELNKLQPYYIRIYGDYARTIIKLLDNKKEFGDWVFRLKKDNLIALEEALLESDGFDYDNATTVNSIDERSLINLQFAFLKLGYNPSFRKLNSGSGFKNGKTQYHLRLRKSFNNQTPFKIEAVPYDDHVFCFTMPEGTLVTLYEGRLGFSGNCRIQRHIEDNPLLFGKVSMSDLQYQKFGWEVYDFLKPVIIDGIAYSHFFANPFSGKPYGGSAANILAKVGQSFSQGHKQTLDMAIRYLPTGERQIGLIAGACLTPDHKVLTADLKYVELGSLKPGDELVSFDEFPKTEKRNRAYKKGTVLKTKRDFKEVFEVKLESGKCFKVTADHQWLVKTNSLYRWTTTDKLRKGTCVPKLLPEWETLKTYEAGWLAGMYDCSVSNNDKVVSITSIGVSEIVMLDIDTKTMIVEDYPHHNCYDHEESYKGPQGNHHFRGIVVKNRVQNGSYDPMFMSLDYLMDKYKNRHNVPTPQFLDTEPSLNDLMNEILKKHARTYMMGEKVLYELIKETSFKDLLNTLSASSIKELKSRHFIEDLSYSNSQEIKKIISDGKVTVEGMFVSALTLVAK